MDLKIRALTGSDAAEIASWRYPPPYDTYDVPGDAAAMMTDPAQRFSAVDDGGDLIGYVCLGAEARVSGLGAQSQTEDLGFGLHPELMGRGLSREILPWLLSAVRDQIAADHLRVVILDWNARSLAAYRSAGFVDAGSHTNDDGTFWLLTRAAGDPPGRPATSPGRSA